MNTMSDQEIIDQLRARVQELEKADEINKLNCKVGAAAMTSLRTALAQAESRIKELDRSHE